MEILPRSAWGPRHEDGFSPAPVPWSENWLHHSVTTQLSPSATLAQEIEQMRNIEQIGESSFGRGISYTRVIFPSGRIFQGHSNDRQGSHTYQRNDRARAICFAGNYDIHEPTEAQLRSAAFVLWLDKKEGRSTGRLNGGHRDVYATACPGARAYNKIARINELAASGGFNQEDDVLLTDSMENFFWDRRKVAVGDVLANGHNHAKDAADASKRVEAKLAAGVPVTVDYDVLADKVVERLGDSIADKLAAALAARLAE